MRCVRSGDHDRVHSAPAVAGADARRAASLVDVGEPYRSDELTAFDHFLTARWILFSAHRGRERLRRGRSTTPWVLHHGRQLAECEDELMQRRGSAAGRRRAARALLARRRRPHRPARTMTELDALVLDDGEAIGVRVVGARQAGESFEQARLVDVELVRCDLSGCDFSEARSGSG